MNGHEFKSILSGKNTLHRKHVDMARKTWPDYITAAFGAENQHACLFVTKSVSNLKSRNKNDARNHYAARPDGLPLGLAARRARGRAVECGSAALWRPAPWRATGHRQLARCKDVATATTQCKLDGESSAGIRSGTLCKTPRAGIFCRVIDVSGTLMVVAYEGP